MLLFYVGFFFFFWLRGMWDPSSLTRDWTLAAAQEGEILTTGLLGESLGNQTLNFQTCTVLPRLRCPWTISIGIPCERRKSALFEFACLLKKKNLHFLSFLFLKFSNQKSTAKKYIKKTQEMSEFWDKNNNILKWRMGF